MWRVGIGLAWSALVGLAAPVGAQQDLDLRRAQAAYDDFDYATAIRLAQGAVRRSIDAADLTLAFELLGYMYAALDSSDQAIDAFTSLIVLDPDREPDPLTVNPNIVAQYRIALSRVLVVRRIRADSTSFVAGMGAAPIRFDVSQPADVRIRALGDGTTIPIDSLSISDQGGVFWSATDADGEPVPPGRYRLVFEAFARPNEFAAQIAVDVSHAPVDTLPHISALPGRPILAEMVRPGRNWRPLGLATLYTAVASGATLALENANLGSPRRAEIGAVSAAVLLTGFIMSLKRPDPEPVQSNILYNQLVREEIARRNAETARGNEVRRRQVRITVRPAEEGSGS